MLRINAMKALIGFGLAAVLAVPAMILSQEATPLMNGVFVTPVPNAPFTATVEFQSTKALAGGTTQRFKTVNNIARDAHGRIYNERRRLVPVTFTGTPELLSGHIFDPETRINIFLNPSQHVARQNVLKGPAPNWDEVPPAPPKGPVSAKGGDNGVRQEDLGTQILENVTVHGQRITSTIPATASGTGQPLVVTHETWYSEDLHVNMLIKHRDPRTGEQTLTIQQLTRDNPDPKMFAVPSDYKVVEEIPGN
jgi:hypothetical protein